MLGYISYWEWKLIIKWKSEKINIGVFNVCLPIISPNRLIDRQNIEILY